MLKILKNYLTENECNKLNELALMYLNNGVLKQGGYKGRYTTRYVDSEFKFEPFVYDISNRIRNDVGINNYDLEFPRGKDGINVAVTLNDGYIELHTDPRADNGYSTYRCNLITQKSEFGGDLIIDDKIVDLDVGDVHCYAVSEVPHIVTDVKGNTPRILWMFGSHIPINDLKDI